MKIKEWERQNGNCPYKSDMSSMDPSNKRKALKKLQDRSTNTEKANKAAENLVSLSNTELWELKVNIENLKLRFYVKKFDEAWWLLAFGKRKNQQKDLPKAERRLKQFKKQKYE